MRINRYVALATGVSRRSADSLVRDCRVKLNQKTARLGDEVVPGDEVILDGHELKPSPGFKTIILNKPAGYVSSRNGQGARTIYELLPEEYHKLKPVGRLDKDSSGLLLLTNDGELANELTHPRHQKEKVYKVKLNKSLSTLDKNKLLTGVRLKDGMSKFIKINDCSENIYEVIMSEGRNRQIRRTFNTLGYKIINLNRIRFGSYSLEDFSPGQFKEITDKKV